jgi:hypothetical protein
MMVERMGGHGMKGEGEGIDCPFLLHCLFFFLFFFTPSFFYISFSFMVLHCIALFCIGEGGHFCCCCFCHSFVHSFVIWSQEGGCSSFFCLLSERFSWSFFLFFHSSLTFSPFCSFFLFPSLPQGGKQRAGRNQTAMHAYIYIYTYIHFNLFFFCCSEVRISIGTFAV